MELFQPHHHQVPPTAAMAALEQKKARAGTPPIVYQPGQFEASLHFYPRTLNAQPHPILSRFLSMGNSRIVKRYVHLHPNVDAAAAAKLLNYVPQHFHWAGCDLLNVTSIQGHRQMVVIETNSCPSGQKSMPFSNDEEEDKGYSDLVQAAFVARVKKLDSEGKLPRGRIAMLYDKNKMENTGYAAALAQELQEDVYLVECYNHDRPAYWKWEDGVLYIHPKGSEWVPIRACFRYVTQKPWSRIPLNTKTFVTNPIVACLAGGRNKMMAAKAYDLFNARHAGSGLEIRVPETIKDVEKTAVPVWVKSMGGFAVVKVPYSNAGQGVFTLTNKEELQAFMDTPAVYNKYIVQSLIGNAKWSSTSQTGQFYHTGTVPDKKGNIYVADVRMTITSSVQGGIRPLVVYARRARKPLPEVLPGKQDSWGILGTNLSVKLPDGSWDTETNRLMLMDTRNFTQLGLGIDDLIDAYMQTAMSMVAIDNMSKQLLPQGRPFNSKLFSSLNNDRILLDEFMKKGGVCAAEQNREEAKTTEQ